MAVMATEGMTLDRGGKKGKKDDVRVKTISNIRADSGGDDDSSDYKISQEEEEVEAVVTEASELDVWSRMFPKSSLWNGSSLLPTTVYDFQTGKAESSA